ncbi:MAG: group III truncated hemoglobin [Lutibacter sp.]
MQKRELQNRSDLYSLVSLFYKKLLNDSELNIFFNHLNDNKLLEKHLQILVNFWDHSLFYSGTYQKNALRPHLLLNKTKPFKIAHFNKWLKLFNESVDELFIGEQAFSIKSKALSIATIMKVKMDLFQ